MDHITKAEVLTIIGNLKQAIHDDFAKSLRWSHEKEGHASTSHGKYHVSSTPDANGHHTVTYTTKVPKGSPRGTKGETSTGKFASHQEALGAVVQHHLKNRPPPKPRKKKDPNAPKVPKVKGEKGRPGGCPPC